ncbi:MAG: metallophosphoesterase [Candidatus Limnocylindrales bacterium]
MSERFKPVAVAIVAILVIGLVPVIALAVSRPSAQAAKPPAASGHGPKKTPRPTTAPTVAPTILPTIVPTLTPTQPPTAAPTSPPNAPPTLPASPAPPAVLVGAGDIASCSSTGDEATANLLDTIAGTVFTLGDNVYDSGTATEFSDCYNPSWGRQLIKDRTRPVSGNHDYNTPGASGYYGYFGVAAGDPTKGYYAYDAGTWRVYVLNSNCSFVSCAAGQAQELWLRADLAANPRACVVAMWHHARFSSGGEHGSSTATQALWQALYDFNADLVLTGHDHNYERFAPQTAGGALDNARGIVEFVVGTGGRSHYTWGTIRANSLVRDNTTFGVLRLALSATSWSFLFIPVAGQTFTDSGTGTCH